MRGKGVPISGKARKKLTPWRLCIMIDLGDTANAIDIDDDIATAAIVMAQGD